MSDERPGQQGGSDAGGVFGNLPGSRPGARSPRRRAGGASAAPKPKPAPEQPAAQLRAPEGARPEPGGPGGLEDMAWAGVAVAAEAATIGIRLASRAIEALRGSTERDREKE